MAITSTPHPDDVADMVSLAQDLDGAGALASGLARQLAEADATGPSLALALHGISEHEAAVLVALLDQVRVTSS